MAQMKTQIGNLYNRPNEDSNGKSEWPNDDLSRIYIYPFDDSNGKYV